MAQALAAALGSQRAFFGVSRLFAKRVQVWAALAAAPLASGPARCMAAVQVSQAAADRPHCAAADKGFVAAAGAAQVGSIFP